MSAQVDLDALLCALILAPGTFARNRYFSLFEDPRARKIRRRAARVRGIIRQLVAQGPAQAEVTGEQVLADGRLLIRYRVGPMSLHRTTALSALEAATLHYALHRAGRGHLDSSERQLVERTLERLSAELKVSATLRRPERR